MEARCSVDLLIDLLCWQASGMQHLYASRSSTAIAGITLALHWLSPPWASSSVSVAVVYGCAADACAQQSSAPPTTVT